MSKRSSNAPRSLPRTPGRRAERRLAAAEAALVAGDITGADALAGQAALNLTPTRTRRMHDLCLQTQGRTAEAVRTLIDAALDMGTADPGWARDTMLEAFGAAQLDGWFGRRAPRWLRLCLACPGRQAEAPGDGLLEGFAAIHEGRTAEGYAVARRDPAWSTGNGCASSGAAAPPATSSAPPLRASRERAPAASRGEPAPTAPAEVCSNLTQLG